MSNPQIDSEHDRPPVLASERHAALESIIARIASGSNEDVANTVRQIRAGIGVEDIALSAVEANNNSRRVLHRHRSGTRANLIRGSTSVLGKIRDHRASGRAGALIVLKGNANRYEFLLTNGF
jgi:hypothetical protein